MIEICLCGKLPLEHARLHPVGHLTIFWFACPDCAITSDGSLDRKKAIEIWNCDIQGMREQNAFAVKRAEEDGE